MGNAPLNKKAKVLKKKKESKRLLIAIPIIAVIVALSVIYIVWNRGDGAAGGGAAEAKNGVLTFDAADFAGGKAEYFSVQTAGKSVDFFVLQSSDGVIRAAFDACDVCYRSKKGYRQEGDYMVCNNCGQSFASTRINIEKGGCNPSPLDRHVEDGVVTIAMSDIAKGAKYF